MHHSIARMTPLVREAFCFRIALQGEQSAAPEASEESPFETSIAITMSESLLLSHHLHDASIHLPQYKRSSSNTLME